MSWKMILHHRADWKCHGRHPAFAFLVYQKWQVCVELGPDSQVNQDARNAQQGHLHLVTLAQQFYLQKKKKLKDLHDVILID